LFLEISPFFFLLLFFYFVTILMIEKHLQQGLHCAFSILFIYFNWTYWFCYNKRWTYIWLFNYCHDCLLFIEIEIRFFSIFIKNIFLTCSHLTNLFFNYRTTISNALNFLIFITQTHGIKIWWGVPVHFLEIPSEVCSNLFRHFWHLFSWKYYLHQYL